jgi:hypothetical protein
MSILKVEKVTKRFGGLVAVDDVTMGDSAGRDSRANRSQWRRKDNAYKCDIGTYIL